MVLAPVAQIVLKFETEQEFLSAEGTRAGVALLGAMLLSFLFIRTSARGVAVGAPVLQA